ncbi:MAG: mucoidy inhibitor MuiA family protein [Bacteroidales bacterium]
MKSIFILLLGLVCCNIYAQGNEEKEVKTKISEATVFLSGAQVVRSKTIDLSGGRTTLKFTGLSPFVDAKSIQVKTSAGLTVLSVNQQQNYLDKTEKSTGLEDLDKQIENLTDKINQEDVYLSIIGEELAFLQANRDVGGKNEQLSVAKLKETSEYYSSRLSSLKMKEIERNKTLIELNKQLQDLQKQRNTLAGEKEYPSGEILVKIDAKQSGTYLFELTYIVDNAGWFPSYDIRANDINSPIQLTYKANVKQDTKVDWDNIKLRFSTASPDVSGVAPELKEYYLDYYTKAPVYQQTSNSVKGKIYSDDGEPIPGATVVVQGTTIGTISDMDGNYSLTVPNRSSQLTFSFIGYMSQTLPITSGVMNVVLEEDNIALEQVVVVGYGSSSSVSSDSYSRKSSSTTKLSEDAKSRLLKVSQGVPTAQVEKQMSVYFEIEVPYTIKSDNKNYIVDMDNYSLPASYQYYCVPKIDKDAFLIANVVDWESYNLLEAEANIFFENTYVGKTLLNVRSASDTLEVSLGRDKNVSVSREKGKNLTNKQFIGNKKEVARVWNTTVKNNKSQTIKMLILDQIPISTNTAIEVLTQNVSEGKVNAETGEVRWEFEIKPKEQKEFELKYSVKYPKNRNLVIE